MRPAFPNTRGLADRVRLASLIRFWVDPDEFSLLTIEGLQLAWEQLTDEQRAFAVSEYVAYLLTGE